jgi:hypothetical protein
VTPGRKERFQIGRAETDRRVRLQIGIFSVVFAVVTALALFRMIRDGIDPFWLLAGFAVGLLIGTLLARSRPLEWDVVCLEVVRSMSVFGIIVTVAYLAFSVLLRDRLIAEVNTASVVALAITGGVMLGRTLVMVRAIRRLLTSAGQFDEHPASHP